MSDTSTATAALEIAKIVALGPVTVLVGAYAWKLHREIRESEAKRIEDVHTSEAKRIADIQAYTLKLEGTVERFYALMARQEEAMGSSDQAIRELTVQVVALKEHIALLFGRQGGSR